MPVPYTNFLADTSILGSTVLALVGGGSKVNRDSAVAASASMRIEAEDFNKQAQAISDVILRLQSRVDVRDFLADDTGATDARAAILLAFAKAKRDGKTLHFGPGRYLLSEALIFDGASGMTITGENAVIVYPSADAALVDATDYDGDIQNRRAAFYLRDCVGTSIHGLTFEGDSSEVDITVNGGRAIALRRCTRTRIHDITCNYGGGMITETNFDADCGTIVSNFHCYGARNASRLGNASWLCNGSFEVPLDDATYDRVGDNGSSHGCYWFASSGSVCGVLNVTMRGVRVDGVKVSGSTATMSTFMVAGCTFDRVGLKADGTSNGGAAVLMGADDINEHNHLTIGGGCQFVDCNAEIVMYGCRGLLVNGVNIHVTEAPAEIKTAFISVARYAADSQPVEAVQISNVSISADPSIGNTLISTAGIALSNIGDVDGANRSSVSISNVDLAHCSTLGISTSRCVAPTFSSIKCTGLTTALSLSGDLRPWVQSLHVVNPRSNNAQIRMTNVSWPIIPPNFYGAGQIGTTAGKCGVGDNANGSAIVENPLLGVTGFAKPSESKPEIVFAYGDDWTPAGSVALGRCSNDPTDTNGSITLVTLANAKNIRIGQRLFASPNSNGSSPRSGTITVSTVDRATGVVVFTGTSTGIAANDYLFQAADQVEINGTLLTYVSSAPGASQFNNITTLLTAIAAVSGGSTYTAADYGADRTPAVTTRHVRIRRVSTSVTANLFYARSFCHRPTAGVFLINYGALNDRCYSRGEGVDKFVIWSPCYKAHAPPIVAPANADAQTAMSASYPMRFLPLPDAGDAEASCTMTVTGLAGTEEFAWRC